MIVSKCAEPFIVDRTSGYSPRLPCIDIQYVGRLYRFSWLFDWSSELKHCDHGRADTRLVPDMRASVVFAAIPAEPEPPTAVGQVIMAERIRQRYHGVVGRLHRLRDDSGARGTLPRAASGPDVYLIQ